MTPPVIVADATRCRPDVAGFGRNPHSGPVARDTNTQDGTPSDRDASNPTAANEPVPEADLTETASTGDGADTSDDKSSAAGADDAERTPRSRSRRTYDTSAARARAVMQRRHLRLALVMSAATGAEVAGTAGLVVAGLLPWVWDEPLWGRTDTSGILTQLALALTGLALLGAWLLRQGATPTRFRMTALVGAVATILLAAALLWQAEPGSRGGGPVVAMVAGLLAGAGCLTWVLAMRQLRKLFPFGLAEARKRGFGNVSAVRRAQFLGGPAAAVLAGAVVAALVLTGGALVGTEDTQISEPVTLSGPPSAASGEPVWTTELPSAPDTRTTQVWATHHGLVVEETDGARGIDPATGNTRWYWRDKAYQRVGGVLTDGGATVVLALDFQGEASDRDLLLALDTGTGEVRWRQYDDELVSAMATLSVAPPEGDWFMVPAQAATPDETGSPQFELRVLNSSDGQVRWQMTPESGCSFLSINGVADVALVGQQCPDPDLGMTCQLRGLDPATGQPRWHWPQEGNAANCQAFPDDGYVFARYATDGEERFVALAADTGAPLWDVSGQDAVALDRPIVVEDTLVALRSPAPGADGGTLLVHAAADGQLRHEVPLPNGQPIGVVTAGDAAMVTLYLPESNSITLAEVDVTAGTVRGQADAGAPPEDTNFYRVSAVAGPATLAVYALVGDAAGAGEFRLVLAGW